MGTGWITQNKAHKKNEQAFFITVTVIQPASVEKNNKKQLKTTTTETKTFKFFQKSKIQPYTQLLALTSQVCMDMLVN